MAGWKTDPLLRLVFEEIAALWDELPTTARPLLLRVEERAPSPTRGVSSTGRLVNIWLYDEYGVRLAPILRREAHDFGEARDGFHRYGLVRFAVAADRSHVLLDYRVGPEVGGEIEYEVQTDSDGIALRALSGTMAH